MKFLKPSKEKIKKYHVYGFDIETTGDTNDFLMGSIVGNGLKKIFFDKYEMIYFILTHQPLRRNAMIVATNLGFDILGLFENTDEMSDLDLLLRGGSVIVANIKDGIRYYKVGNKIKSTYNHKITFIDTMNFLKASVKTLGQIIGLEKLPYPECLKRKEAPKNTEERIELIRYNVRDSEISKRFFEFLQESFNDKGVNIKCTISSTALALFQKRYMKSIFIQPPKKVLQETYKGYYGGRTEAFKRGYIKKKLYYYDINNLYGGAMLNSYPMPNSIRTTNRGSERLIHEYHGLTEVQLRYDKKTFIPFLPCRHPDTEKLLFPIGKIKGWYTHIELREALKQGYKIENIGKTIYYTTSFRPFTEYILDNYKDKLRYHKEKSPLELVAKILNNGLYGKWAQKMHGKQQVLHMDNVTIDVLDHYMNNKNYKTEQIGDYLYITDLIGIDYPSFINPILSIYTTAYAKLIMQKYFNKYQEDILYTDTDSLISQKPIKVSEKIGKMKLEHIMKECIIVKPKTYGFITEDDEHVIRSKGMPRLETFDEFRRLLKERQVSFKKFVKFKEANRSNHDHKRGKLKYNQVIDVLKEINLEDTKRLWKRPFDSGKFQKSRPITI